MTPRRAIVLFTDGHRMVGEVTDVEATDEGATATFTADSPWSERPR